jgi:hypothetical protein
MYARYISYDLGKNLLSTTATQAHCPCCTCLHTWPIASATIPIDRLGAAQSRTAKPSLIGESTLLLTPPRLANWLHDHTNWQIRCWRFQISLNLPHFKLHTPSHASRKFKISFHALMRLQAQLVHSIGFNPLSIRINPDRHRNQPTNVNPNQRVRLGSANKANHAEFHPGPKLVSNWVIGFKDSTRTSGFQVGSVH